LALLLASLSIFVVYAAYKISSSKQPFRREKYVPLFTDDTSEDSPLVDDIPGADIGPTGIFGDDGIEAAPAALARSLSVSLDDVNVYQDKPRLAVFVPLLETILVFARLALCCTEVGLGLYSWRPVVVGCLWFYLFTLIVFRWLLRGDMAYSIWGHSVALYIFLWPLAFFNLRSAVVQHSSGIRLAFPIANLCISTILCVLVLTCRRGNKSVIRVSAKGLQPPQDQVATLFSLWTFSWVDPLIFLGWKKILTMEDVWDLAPEDQASFILSKYRGTKQKMSVALRLFYHFKYTLAYQMLWSLLYCITTFAPTLLLRQILEYLDNPDRVTHEVAWLYVIGLAVSSTVTSIANGQALWLGRRISIQLKAIIIGEVYAKALRRRDVAPKAGTSEDSDKTKAEGLKAAVVDETKKVTASQANNGTVINLMAVDAVKVSEICAYLHYLVVSVPIQLVICLLLLYNVLGLSALAGVATMILLAPVQYFVASRFNVLQERLMTASDKRVTRLNELLQNVRIVKFFAWEEMFVNKVNEAREVELKHLKERFTLWAVYVVMWYGTPALITLLSFTVHTKVLHQQLTAPVAFTAISLFMILRAPLDQLADMITNVLQSKVSLDRVAEYLQEEDTEKYTQTSKYDEVNSTDPYIGFRNATIAWASRSEIISAAEAGRPQDSLGFQLLDIDVKFPSGSLSLIIGPTGSGKVGRYS